jgi:retinol dehydrogenase-14
VASSVAQENEPKEKCSMRNKTVLITGATSGIGFYTAQALMSQGARVIVTGRDEERGLKAVGELRRHTGHDRVHFFAVDHSTVGGNQELAERVSEEFERLHVLVNNVGRLYNDRRETSDGYEATLAMDLVGPFALTEALLPALRSSAPARVVNVASAGHAMWRGDPFVDLQFEGSYRGFEAYARSKLLKILWTFALARRLEGSGVIANAINPGMAWTSGTEGIARRSMPALQRLFWPVFRRMQRRGSAERAAHASVFLASSPEAASVTGTYFESNAKPKRPSALALDVDNQERAWDLAATLTTQASTALTSRPALRKEREPKR